jgi:hypothetical protein
MNSINYANDESFRTYVDYLALKKHFTTKGYDYHKYNGKVKASFSTFQTRNDAFFFYKLSQKKDPHGMILANVLHNPNVWIRDVIEEEGNERYLDWKGRINSLTYLVSQDLKHLDDSYKENFIVKNGQHPYILSLFLQRKISLETITILSNLANIFDYWEANIVDKIVASDKILISKKYFPFLEIDRKKFSSLVKNHFNPE